MNKALHEARDVHFVWRLEHLAATDANLPRQLHRIVLRVLHGRRRWLASQSARYLFDHRCGHITYRHRVGTSILFFTVGGWRQAQQLGKVDKHPHVGRKRPRNLEVFDARHNRRRNRRQQRLTVNRRNLQV